MVDTDTATLRSQALLMQRLSPDERLRRVLAWSAELLLASREHWMACSAKGDGERPVASVHARAARLEAWLRAQHGPDIAPGFAAAREAWLRRQDFGT
jgi:hypothetical protein